MVNKRAFSTSRDRSGKVKEYLLIHELHNLMREGVSAVLEAVNELSPEVAALTDTLGLLLRARSTANAYMSFGMKSGFGPHNDDHDVLIFQIDGRKKWQFFESGDGSGKATVKDVKSAEALVEGDHMILCKGEMLFVPKGTWHNVLALNERSLHLTVSIVYPTLHDFILWCMRRDAFDAPFQDIRPAAQGKTSALRECQQFFKDSLSAENMDIFLKTYYAGVGASRVAPDFPCLNMVSLSQYFLRIPFEAPKLADQAQSAYSNIYALGKNHLLSDGEFNILSKLRCDKPIGGMSLKVFFATPALLLVALQRLVDLGLVNVVAQSECSA